MIWAENTPRAIVKTTTLNTKMNVCVMYVTSNCSTINAHLSLDSNILDNESTVGIKMNKNMMIPESKNGCLCFNRLIITIQLQSLIHMPVRGNFQVYLNRVSVF